MIRQYWRIWSSSREEFKDGHVKYWFEKSIITAFFSFLWPWEFAGQICQSELTLKSEMHAWLQQSCGPRGRVAAVKKKVSPSLELNGKTLQTKSWKMLVKFQAELWERGREMMHLSSRSLYSCWLWLATPIDWPTQTQSATLGKGRNTFSLAAPDLNIGYAFFGGRQGFPLCVWEMCEMC